eukprot:6178918-Pleurochrysis_carterae.AAC.1
MSATTTTRCDAGGRRRSVDLGWLRTQREMLVHICTQRTGTSTQLYILLFCGVGHQFPWCSWLSRQPNMLKVR